MIKIFTEEFDIKHSESLKYSEIYVNCTMYMHCRFKFVNKTDNLQNNVIMNIRRNSVILSFMTYENVVIFISLLNSDYLS